MDLKTLHFLNKLKNGSLKNKATVYSVYNPLFKTICILLYKEGFIQSYYVLKEKNIIKIILRYCLNKPILRRLVFYSTPSRNIYLNIREIRQFNSNKQLYVVSTNIGLLSEKECKKKGVGGILLFSC